MWKSGWSRDVYKLKWAFPHAPCKRGWYVPMQPCARLVTGMQRPWSSEGCLQGAGMASCQVPSFLFFPSHLLFSVISQTNVVIVVVLRSISAHDRHICFELRLLTRVPPVISTLQSFEQTMKHRFICGVNMPEEIEGSPW
jgi:hypothetical protein